METVKPIIGNWTVNYNANKDSVDSDAFSNGWTTFQRDLPNLFLISVECKVLADRAL